MAKKTKTNEEKTKRFKADKAGYTALKDKMLSARGDAGAADKEYLAGAKALYKLIGECFSVYVGFKDANKQVREFFNKEIEGLAKDGLIINTSATPLERKVVRYVTLGVATMKDPRTKVYANTLRIAYDLGIHEDGDLSFAEWVEGMGGFEGVTRGDNASKNPDDRNDAVEKAVEFYTSSLNPVLETEALPPVIANKFKAEKQHSHASLAVALVRKEPNKGFTILDIADSQAAVTATLKYLGKNRTFTLQEGTTIINAKTGEEVSEDEAQAELEAA
jgi:hypothetical protein